MKNIEAQGRLGALITWVNSMDAGRMIGSIRKTFVARLQNISDNLDGDANLSAILEDYAQAKLRIKLMEDALEDIADHPGPNADENAWYRVNIAREALGNVREAATPPISTDTKGTTK